ncbi:MAG TPA: ABC transporter permease [Lachnospiraceae bacterium]|nr:ABC transporter permease [Lachnospiraceae bacterium]
MGKYIAKRVVFGLATLLVVSILTFFLMNLVPGGPFTADKSISKAAQKALAAKYGLDKPLWQQFFNYMKAALHGDFGISLKQRGRTVAQIIGTKFPVSARIGGISILVSLAIGIPFGCIAALHRGKAADRIIIIFATCGIAVPSFVICTVLMYFFGVKLGWLPTFGLTSWLNYIMPVMALAFYPTSYIARQMRSSMLDVLGQDYMRTAKAKGLSQNKILYKHALRNAILPIVTYLGPLVAYTLVGSFVVEKIFTIPGLGGEFVSSVINQDYTVIMGTTIFLAALVIFMNVVVDIAYTIIDPRIKLK